MFEILPYTVLLNFLPIMLKLMTQYYSMLNVSLLLLLTSHALLSKTVNPCLLNAFQIDPIA